MSDDFRKMICVDFDGVLHSYLSGWGGASVIQDPPVPGAINWLASMILESDFDIGILSARNHQEGGRHAMRSWLCGAFVSEGYVQPQKLADKIFFPDHKPPECVMFIDDRAFCFRGTFPSLVEIEHFQPWYK